MQARAVPTNSADLAKRLLLEGFVPFTAIARKLGVHISTLHRWRRGGAAVPLEAARVGGRWMSSWQAVDRFVTAPNAAGTPPPPPPTVGSRRSAAVERQLDAEGL